MEKSSVTIKQADESKPMLKLKRNKMELNNTGGKNGKTN